MAVQIRRKPAAQAATEYTPVPKPPPAQVATPLISDQPAPTPFMQRLVALALYSARPLIQQATSRVESALLHSLGVVQADLSAHEQQIASDSTLGHVKVGTNLTISADGTLNAPSAAGDKTYRHVQSVAAATWTVPHSLNKYPAISVVDSAGDACYGNVDYLDQNTVTIAFSAPFSGEAYAN